MAALALAGALLLPAGASAAQLSGQAGGGGGQPFTLTCGDGRALIGIRGRAGNVVDSIRGVCATIDELGAVTATSTTAATGGSGGEYDYELRCPSSQVVTGLRGRASSFLDEVSLACARLATLDTGAVDPAGRTDGDVAGIVDRGRSTARLFASAGDGNGGAPFTLNCPGTLPARGLQGRSAALVDRIGLVCDPVTIAPALPQPLLTIGEAAGVRTGLTPVQPLPQLGFAGGRTQPVAPPDLRAVLKDVPFVHGSPLPLEVTVELWNVGTAGAPAGAVLELAGNFPLALPVDFEVTAGSVGAVSLPTTTAPRVRFETAAAAPRGSRALGLRVQLPPAPAGNRELTARADPGNQLAETNGGEQREPGHPPGDQLAPGPRPTARADGGATPPAWDGASVSGRARTVAPPARSPPSARVAPAARAGASSTGRRRRGPPAVSAKARRRGGAAIMRSYRRPIQIVPSALPTPFSRTDRGTPGATPSRLHRDPTRIAPETRPRETC